MQSIVENLNAVVSQNETIATGMIAISDKLDDFMDKQTGRSSLGERKIFTAHHGASFCYH